MSKIIGITLMVLLLSGMVCAEVSTTDITAPLNKIYDLVKAGVTIVALIMLTVSGFRYMTSGDNPLTRDAAKQSVVYIVAGLVIVWVAPLMVTYLTAPALG